MLDWLWQGALNVLLGWVPTWAWIIVAGLLAGWAWKKFGWQGIAGAILAVLTLGAYRQGWRDRGAGRQPIVPPDPIPRPYPPPAPKRPPRNVWSVRDILRGRNE